MYVCMYACMYVCMHACIIHERGYVSNKKISVLIPKEVLNKKNIVLPIINTNDQKIYIIKINNLLS